MQRKPILTPLMVRQEPALPLLFWWFFSLGCFPVFLALIQAGWLAWVGPISKWGSLSAAVGWTGFHLIGARAASKSSLGLLPVGIVLCFLTMAALFPIAAYTFDFSYDGNWYHLKAIRALALESWNPYYEYLPHDVYPNGELYVNHYAKASWLAAASWVQLFEIQDLGRINQWLLMLSALGSGLVIAFGEKRNKGLKAIIMVLAAFNPVSVNLMFSHYIDGEMASGLLLLMIGLYQAEKTSSKSLGIGLLLLAVYVANLKFTGLLYVVLIGGAWTWRQLWIAQISPGMFLLTVIMFALLGIGGLGYPTYIRNYTERGNIFYPLLGEGNVSKNVSEACYPQDFYNTNRFERFFKSNTAEPAFVRAPEKTARRPLFQIPKDIGNYDVPAPELNSFVPFFQEILVLSILLMLILLILGKMTLAGWILFILIISPVFWLEQNWMARYIPQLWFAPLLLLWHASNRKHPGILTYSLTLFITVNLVIIHTRLINRQMIQDRSFHGWLEEIKKKPDLEIGLGWMGSDEMRLKAAGVKWTNAPMIVPENEIEKAPWYGHLHNLFVRKKP